MPQMPAESTYADIDGVTLRVLGGALDAIAREMAQVLYRMSNSSIIRESEDIGCGIFDAAGREFCESDTSPMHIGSLPFYIRGFMKKLAGRIEEGDVIIHSTIPSGSSVTNCARRHPAPGGSVAAAAMSGMFVFSSTGSFRAMATARSKRPPACSVDAMGWAPASSSIRVGPTRPSGRRRYRAAVSAPAT